MAFQGLLVAAALASAFTGAVCYVFYGPSPTSRKRNKRSPPGLINLGKSCFLNSILQAFASCQTINSWLESLSDNFTDAIDDENVRVDESKSLILTTYKLLQYLNNRDINGQQIPTLTSTNDIIRALQIHRWVITNEEQDAHEMFHIFTTTMEDELRAKMSTSSINVDFNGLTSGILSRCCESLPTVSQTVGKLNTKLPFRGLLASQLRCESCLYKSPLKFDTFDSLSLSIPTRKWPQVMLQDCLRNYMMPERVKDVECEKCTGPVLPTENHTHKIMKKSAFIKQLTIGKLPELLCIHIQRMAWLDNGIPTKRYEHVIFPVNLNISEFRIGYQSSNKANYLKKINVSNLVGGSSETHDKNTTSEENGNVLSALPITSAVNQWNSANKRYLYNLQSVIVHLGDVHSGHFVTYRRGAIGSGERNRWFFCSDSNVQEVTVEQVLQCDAYMLFYERIKV